MLETEKIYNEYMGGVGKLNFLIFLYRIISKININFVPANAWIEYQDKDRTYRGHTHTHTHTKKKKKILDLIGFHENIAEYLIKAELPRKHSSFSHPRNDAEKSELPVKKEI